MKDKKFTPEEITESLKSRKTIAFLVENAVAVAPAASEE